MRNTSLLRKSMRSSSSSSSSACLLSPLRVVFFLGICLVALTHYYRLLLLQSSVRHRQALLAKNHNQFPNQSVLAVTAASGSEKQEKCAILFYGLPRAFSLVLPSIQQHVIHVNRDYGCDYFVHYYNQTVEMTGRSGQGGSMDVNEILRLAQAVELEESPSSSSAATIHFASDTNETFYASHADIVREILTAKDETGRRPLYYSWMERDYAFPQSMLNILKMMHSMEQAWQLMQNYGVTHGVTYTRVALLRADVVFLTPFDIWNAGGSGKDVNNAHVVIPSFARYPVNDRGIYGNAKGVQIWATGRFHAMARHVQDFRGSGYVMHNERFVDSVILPAIRQQAGLTVVEHDAWCFCRARVGQRVWLNDCTKGSTSAKLKRTFPDTPSLVRTVEHAVNATCVDVQKEGVSGALSVHCHRS